MTRCLCRIYGGWSAVVLVSGCRRCVSDGPQQSDIIRTTRKSHVSTLMPIFRTLLVVDKTQLGAEHTQTCRSCKILSKLVEWYME